MVDLKTTAEDRLYLSGPGGPMSAKPAPDDPSVIKPGVRVVRRHPKAKRSTWGVLVLRRGLWLPLRRPHSGARCGFVDAWWLTRAGAAEAAMRLP